MSMSTISSSKPGFFKVFKQRKLSRDISEQILQSIL